MYWRYNWDNYDDSFSIDSSSIGWDEQEERERWAQIEEAYDTYMAKQRREEAELERVMYNPAWEGVLARSEARRRAYRR